MNNSFIQCLFRLTIWDSDPILFDNTQPSLFLPEGDDFWTTTDAAALSNPCVAEGEGESNLFSRDDHPQCLPPVNIGDDALQLFESPLNFLEENILLPFKRETPPIDPNEEIPGPLLLNGAQGDWNPKVKIQEGWQPYTGGVRIEPTDDNTCQQLTADRGIYNVEVCCNWNYVGAVVESELDKSRIANIDARTIANQDIGVIRGCLCTTVFCSLIFVFVFSYCLFFFFFLYFVPKVKRGSFEVLFKSVDTNNFCLFGSRHPQLGLSFRLCKILSLLQYSCRFKKFLII